MSIFFRFYFFLLLIIIGFGDCNQKSSDTTGDFALLLRLSTLKSKTDKLDSNPFTRTVPSSFAVASTTAAKTLSTAKSFGIGKNSSLTRGFDEDFPVDFPNKKRKIQTTLEMPDNISDCINAIPSKFKLARSTPSCYAPSVGYANHPDGVGIPGFGAFCPGYPFCLPPGDLGLWQSAEASGEACAAAQLNALVEYTGNKVDLAMGIFAAMACISEKNKNKLPEKGEVQDLVQSLNALTAASGLIFKNATLERDVKDTDSRPVYFIRTEIAKKITKLDNTTFSIVFFLTMKHSPKSVEDYANYKGVFNFQGLEPDYRSGAGGAGAVKRGLSVTYEKTGTVLKYKMQNALFNSGTPKAAMFKANLELNPNPSTSEAGIDGWTHDYNIMISSLDDNGWGSLAYGWQAGGTDGYFRAFNVETKSDETGTAYFGFADNNALGTGNLKIDRMICNWAGPKNNRIGKQKVQKQTIKYDIRYNIYVPVTNNITYAPTNSCDWNYATNPATRFEGITSTGITNDLVDMSAYTFTQPEAPTPP